MARFDGDGDGLGSDNAVLVQSLARNFWRGMQAELADARDDLQNVLGDLRGINAGVRRLSDGFQQLQSFARERNSYVLTFVTTVTAPAQILAGVYGMNFVKMPEL